MFSEVDPLSPRYVLAHVKALPMESATVASQRGGPEFVGWNEDRYMMATLLNTQRILLHLFILANIDPKKPKPPFPERYPLPDKVEKKRQDAQPGSFAHTAIALLAKGKKRKQGGG